MRQRGAFFFFYFGYQLWQRRPAEELHARQHFYKVYGKWTSGIDEGKQGKQLFILLLPLHVGKFSSATLHIELFSDLGERRRGFCCWYLSCLASDIKQA